MTKLLKYPWGKNSSPSHIILIYSRTICKDLNYILSLFKAFALCQWTKLTKLWSKPSASPSAHTSGHMGKPMWAGEGRGMMLSYRESAEYAVRVDDTLESLQFCIPAMLRCEGWNIPNGWSCVSVIWSPALCWSDNNTNSWVVVIWVGIYTFL